MTTQRPTGVTILAVLQLIGGVINVLFGISSLFFGGLIVVSKAVETAGSPINMGPIILAAGVLAVISGLLGLFAGYGLFTLKSWGWILALIFSVLNIVYNGLKIFQGANIPGTFVGIAISGLIIYYLNRPNIKRAFGRA
jgi:uncharacterized membrane protein (DUF2068 family)